MTRRNKKRLISVILISLATALVLISGYWSGLLFTWQSQSTDFLFKAKVGDPSTRVGIVAIDDRSVRELAGDGRLFVWPRSHYARVISALAGAGVRVIALDLLFDAPSKDDALLVEAIASSTVVLPVAGDAPSTSAGGRSLAYDVLASPLPEMARLAAGVGHANVHPDGDGTVRRQQLSITIQAQEMPSLALAASARYLRRPEVLERSLGTDTIPFAGRSIPVVDGRRGMAINYLGPSYQEDPTPKFPIVSFVDVLRGNADLSLFRDRVAFVGVTAMGFADDYWTPPSLGRKMSGVEVHAHATDTILRAGFLRPMERLETALLILALSILAGLGALFLRAVVAAGLALGLLVSYLLIAFGLFDLGVIPNMLYPPLAPILGFGAVTVYRVVFAESDQRAARRLLSGYLSPSVMQEVLKEPEQLRLGGEKKTMTVLFSDIRGFTTISERIGAEALVSFLNRYLTEMSAVVFDYGGVVDKYMGDGIMAFWGAPISDPDHARRACLAAVQMMERLAKIQEEWRESLPSLNIGVGINTGEMLVGNMGSTERFSYTVLGDAVNLAARLEGLNKLYGTNIIVSEATLQNAGEGFRSRFLDLVVVKGKQEPVGIYELLPCSADGTTDISLERQELCRLYEEAMALAGQRRWNEAGDAYQRVLNIFPDDGPSVFHLERCKELADSSPDGWDGVYIAKTK
jgi:adenylate cyclase